MMHIIKDRSLLIMVNQLYFGMTKKAQNTLEMIS